MLAASFGERRVLDGGGVLHVHTPNKLRFWAATAATSMQCLDSVQQLQMLLYATLCTCVHSTLTRSPKLSFSLSVVSKRRIRAVKRGPAPVHYYTGKPHDTGQPREANTREDKTIVNVATSSRGVARGRWVGRVDEVLFL